MPFHNPRWRAIKNPRSFSKNTVCLQCEVSTIIMMIHSSTYSAFIEMLRDYYKKKKTLNYNLSPNKIQIPNVDPCCALQGDGAAPHTSAEERVAFSSMAERLLRKQPLGSTVFAGWVHGTGPHGTHRTGPVLDGGSFARGLVCVCVCLVGETATTRGGR